MYNNSYLRYYNFFLYACSFPRCNNKYKLLSKTEKINILNKSCKPDHAHFLVQSSPQSSLPLESLLSFPQGWSSHGLREPHLALY